MENYPVIMYFDVYDEAAEQKYDLIDFSPFNAIKSEMTKAFDYETKMPDSVNLSVVPKDGGKDPIVMTGKCMCTLTGNDSNSPMAVLELTSLGGSKMNGITVLVDVLCLNIESVRT